MTVTFSRRSQGFYRYDNMFLEKDVNFVFLSLLFTFIIVRADQKINPIDFQVDFNATDAVS